jgi:peroxiredoxin
VSGPAGVAIDNRGSRVSTFAALLALGTMLTPLAIGRAQASVGQGQRAPEFSLPSLQGGTVALSSFRGKVVLIDFWAQWCEPCKRELPELDQLAKQYAGKGVVVLTVNIDKQRDNAARLARQLNLSLPVLLDPSGAVAGTFDPPKMPSSFVVDKKGIVRYVNAGYENGDIAHFKKELDELVAK